MATETRAPAASAGSVVFALAFAAMLAAPLVLTLLAGGSAGTNVENRQLAGMPGLGLLLDAPAGFATALDRYWGDNFEPRSTLIRLNNVLRLAVLGEPPVKGVRKGQGRWLYYSNEWDFEDYEGVSAFRPDELERIGRNLEERRAWLAARNIGYVVAVAPNKSSAYPEFLPRSVHKLGPTTRLDQVAEAMRRHPDIDFVDLRGPLAEAKGANRTYDYTDTHWNAYGAFAGYRAIMDRVAARYPAVRPLTLDDFDVRAVDGPGGDLAGMLDLKGSIPEERIVLVPRFAPRARDGRRDYPDPVTHPGRDMVVKDTGDPRLPKALVFRDSFSWQLIPFLSESFRSVVYVWTFDFLPELIEREQPDVVILECVERYLNALLLDNPPKVRAALAPRP